MEGAERWEDKKEKLWWRLYELKRAKEGKNSRNRRQGSTLCPSDLSLSPSFTTEAGPWSQFWPSEPLPDSDFEAAPSPQSAKPFRMLFMPGKVPSCTKINGTNH